jgi:hypothetical protein
MHTRARPDCTPQDHEWITSPVRRNLNEGKAGAAAGGDGMDGWEAETFKEARPPITALAVGSGETTVIWSAPRGILGARLHFANRCCCSSQPSAESTISRRPLEARHTRGRHRSSPPAPPSHSFTGHTSTGRTSPWRARRSERMPPAPNKARSGCCGRVISFSSLADSRALRTGCREVVGAPNGGE